MAETLAKAARGERHAAWYRRAALTAALHHGRYTFLSDSCLRNIAAKR